MQKLKFIFIFDVLYQCIYVAHLMDKHSDVLPLRLHGTGTRLYFQAFQEESCAEFYFVLFVLLSV